MSVLVPASAFRLISFDVYFGAVVHQDAAQPVPPAPIGLRHTGRGFQFAEPSEGRIPSGRLLRGLSTRVCDAAIEATRIGDADAIRFQATRRAADNRASHRVDSGLLGGLTGPRQEWTATIVRWSAKLLLITTRESSSSMSPGSTSVGTSGTSVEFMLVARRGDRMVSSFSHATATSVETQSANANAVGLERVDLEDMRAS